MKYTPRQVAAFQYFMHRRSRVEEANRLVLENMAARGEPKKVQRVAAKMARE